MTCRVAMRWCSRSPARQFFTGALARASTCQTVAFKGHYHLHGTGNMHTRLHGMLMHVDRFTSHADPRGRPRDDDSMQRNDRRIEITKGEQQQLSKQHPKQPHNPKTLRVGIIGVPNAGKSTLANALLGWRFAAVSKKVHTTRHQAIGVLTNGSTQIVFLDTPGITTPGKIKRHRLEWSLLTDPHSTLFTADIIIVLVDVSNIWSRSRLDLEILKALYLHQNKTAILVLNKVDLLKSKEQLLKVTRKLTEGRVGKRKDSRKSKPRDDGPSRQRLETMFDEMDEDKLDKLDEQDDVGSYQQVHNSPLFMDGSVDLSDTRVEKEVVTPSDQRESVISSDLPTTGETQDIIPTNTPYRETEDRISGDTPDTAEVKEVAITDILQRLQAIRSSSEVMDLTNKEQWNGYFRLLQAIGKDIEDQEGWSHFDRVFMISAKDGDGVEEIKDYLIENAKPGQWSYHGDMVTDQDPLELAKECVWEKLMDCLPSEVPYIIHIVPVLWEIDEYDMLRAAFDLVCYQKRHMHLALGKNGETVQKVAREAKQELMNTFKRELTLKLAVRMGNKRNKYAGPP